MCFVGMAKLQLGSDAEAVSWLQRSTEANRNYPIAHLALAAALGLTGALDEARTAARTGLALSAHYSTKQQPDLPCLARALL
jgi:Flp pilus assembly protein TadD